ncbi:translation initiation factor IF-2 [Paenibacillus glacialis]|uniref:Translation initiation factor IF-2 n=1 Tax=Paenibacillus glacialis TaxID=494026 RepID=A0A162K6E0_9BACL|nr:translation initiation factor IF-2 [Paenibacillus glacialis]OAB41378.1 translation initiation factor IF-2 [Paenibacillus glacialis]
MTKQESNKEKFRVYEYAKSLNMSSKEIITILKRLDLPVNNHMSVMENDAVTKVEKFFENIKSNAAAKRESGDSHAMATTSSVKKDAVVIKPNEASASRHENSTVTAQDETKKQQEKQVGMNNNPNNNNGTGTVTSRPQSSTGTSRPQSSNNGSTRPQSSGAARPASSQGGQRPSAQQGSNGANRPSSPSQGQGGGQRSSSPTARPQSQNRSTGAPTRDASRTDGAAQGDNRGANKNRSNNNGSRRFDDNKGGNYRNNRGGKNGRGKANYQAREKIDNTPKKIIVRGVTTVGESAKLLHKDASEVIKKLITMGVMATINQELDVETVLLLAGEFGVEVEVKIAVEDDRFETMEEVDEESDLKSRPPVVTIMGHVDHGKTTLLDAIRSSNVTSGEAGGITQHIGAYQVEINNKKITFLDTPGHEAFTAMRARGAQVTDITIIVVAADDGVMPQTVEAISHAKAAELPIIVAVNKIDKPGADPDKVKQELTEYGLVPEEWGGDTIFVNVSAKQRTGLEDLLEMILLVAEMNEYKANPDKRARATVLEAELDKGRGPVARVLVQHGTLRVGDAFVAGNCFGRIRAMVNDKGRRLKEAGPSTPVEITGLTEVPQAGDPFMVFEDERKARSIADKRSITQRQSDMGSNVRVTLDDLFQHIKDGEIKGLNVIIKGDVQGTVEALKSSLEKIEVEGVRVKILHSGAGAITESDIILAAASSAIVIGYNVRPDNQAALTAAQEKVDIRLHRVIYNVIEEIEQAMKGMLDPIYKENIIGHAEVRSVFTITKVGTVSGCMVTSGKITRNAELRLIRNSIVIHEGKIDSLKRFKDDAKEVAQGYECGITLASYNDVKEGDVIEAFIMETVERK